MADGRKFFDSATDPSISALASVGILTSPKLSYSVFNWISSQSRILNPFGYFNAHIRTDNQTEKRLHW